MRNRRDAVQRDRKGGMQIRRDADTGYMLYRRDRKGWMQDRRDEGLDRFMKLGMRNRRDSGHEG